MEVDARFRGLLIPNSNIDTERQGITTTARERHETAPLGTTERHIYSLNVHCTGMNGNLKLNDMEVVMVFFFFQLERYFLSKMGIIGVFCGQVAAVDHHHRVGLV